MIDENRQAIEQVLSGQSEAYRTIVKNHQRLVSMIVFRMVPRVADREDICQDVFVKVYQNLGGFKGEARLSTWIARITHNTCLNYLEKKRPVLHDDHAKEGEGIDCLPSHASSPEADADHADLSARLLGEIRLLPEKYRTILTLFHLEEMTYGEIGDVMHLPGGTVKSYLFRARRMLKEQLVAKYSMEDLCL